MKPRNFRHVNDKDIVTNVPLPPLYKHAGTLEYFDSDGKRQTDVSLWDICKDQVFDDARDLMCGTFRPEAIKNHPMKGYVALLKKTSECEVVEEARRK